MKRVLIAGVGNILLGDDGVGPHVVRELETDYAFEEGVVVEDLGTPALDFIDHIAGLDALIVVDSVENGDLPGTVSLYRKPDLLRFAPTVRLDPHSPALTESLLAAEMFGGSPHEVLLVGISGASYEPGCDLSAAVREGLKRVRAEILRELDRLGIVYARKEKTTLRGILWMPLVEA